MTDSLHICLIAGEASGDYLGGKLMHELKGASPNVRFSGVGGTLMRAEGLESLFPMNDLSVMGLLEVLPRIPLLKRRIAQTARHIRQNKPDIVVTIDSPDFCFRVSRALHAPPERSFGEIVFAYARGDDDGEEKFNMPRMIHYVAPTVWAWRPERAKKMAALYDGVLCLFPFEPPWFEAEGMKAAFIGHPVLESGYDKANGDKLRKELNIPKGAKILGVLFGSRMGELNRTGPALREAARKFAQENPDAHILSLTLPHLEREVRNLLQGIPCPAHIISDQSRKWECFATMQAALATSGTVGMELAVADIPHAIAYRANFITAQIVKRKITVRYAHLVNILFEDEIVPEFIQEKCKAPAIFESLISLMNDDVARARQKIIFEKFRELISAPGGASSSQLAAQFIVSGGYSSKMKQATAAD